MTDQSSTTSINTSMTPSTISTETTPLAVRPLLLGGLFVLLLGALAANIISTGRSPLAVASIFSTRFLGIFIEAVPFLLLGSLTSGLIEAFVSPADVARYMPKNKYLSTVCGAFLGLVFPVCECGVVPVARRLFRKGLPVSVGISFLLAAPFMNPIVFASTYIAFGFGTVFVGRFVITALVAITVGLIFAQTAKADQVLLPVSQHDDAHAHDHHHSHQHTGVRDGVSHALDVAVNEFFEMGRYLVIGCLMAAGMQTLVPQEILLGVGSGPVISVLAMLALGFVLSVCSTVDAFLALAFVNTFTSGSILAFLSFGPMVDIKSTMMFLGVFRRRVVLYLILLPFLMNLLAGVVINLWF